MIVSIDPNTLESYDLFLRVKGLPKYRFVGRTAEFPDEYASLLGVVKERPQETEYQPAIRLWDYQRDIAALAIRKRKFAAFMDCGLGKTLILLEFARHAQQQLPGKRVLIVSPIMVIAQTMEEAKRFYGDSYALERVPAHALGRWLEGDHIGNLAANCAGDVLRGVVGITNYEAIRPELRSANLGCLILDESSMLKSHYGKWGTKLIDLGRGLQWKLCLTGTPAPNDRIEYANHAVFLDAFPTVNSFLARFFVNRGQTAERWELKKHALRPFYTALSHWSIFVTNPATYGWHDNTAALPPINVNIHDVPLTSQQKELVAAQTGQLFAHDLGGIMTRSALGQISKGNHKGKRISTHKPEFIRSLIASWEREESTLVWCLYNAEQKRLEKALPTAASLAGDTPLIERQTAIAAFKAGTQHTLISKSKILGFGLNLHKATRQVFSGLQDSYEMYYQCVKRSNRYGAHKSLNVHIPVTEVEYPMVENVLRKARNIQQDTEEQEKLFKENGHVLLN